MGGTGVEHSANRVDVADGSRVALEANRERSRTWPRCELGSTHFELGASSDQVTTIVLAKRYTPKLGVRKESP
jgi:hypothetical protein